MKKPEMLLSSSSILTLAFLMSISALDTAAANCSLPGGSPPCFASMAPSLLPVTVDEGAVEINGFQVSHPSDNAIVGTTSGKQASLVISNGGTLENLRGIVGDVAGSEGEVLVTGPNSAWNNIERLIVGNDGVGTLSIEKGAKVTSGPFSAVGWGAGSVGNATITGTGSHWSFDYAMDIGSGGKGTMTIADGGALSGDDLFVGYDTDGQGSLLLKDKGSSIDVNEFYVGFYGKADVKVENGAELKSALIRLATQAGSEGLLEVSGKGTVVTTGPILAGTSGKSDIIVRDGGALNTNSLRMGILAGSNSSVTISGSNAKLNADEIWFGNGKSTLDFHHNNELYEFSGKLISKHIDGNTWKDGITVGTHELHQSSGKTLLSGDNSLFQGKTYVEGGTLLIGNKLGGDVLVSGGGALGGSGAIGTTDALSTVTIASGGILAPGNLNGGLTINGDLIFAAGSSYQVNVDPKSNASDHVYVSGKASLNGGSVLHVGASGNYNPFSTYRILTVGNELTGAFNGVTSNFAFLTPELIYDYAKKTVDLKLSRNDMKFANKAMTANQRSLAGALDTLKADGNALYTALVTLGDDQATIQSSFDALSGEVHASAKSALIENTLLTQNAITNRLRSAFNEPVATPPIEPLGYGPERKQPTAFNSVVDKDRVAATYGGWAQAYGHWLKQDGNSNVGEFSASSGGFVAGIDNTIADSWRVGVLAGYGQTSFHSNDRASSGNSDNYTLGAYAGSQWAMSHGVLAFSSGIAYTWHQLETERSVAFNGFSDRLNADYDAGSLVAFGELGYKIAAGRSTFEPYANLTNVYHKTNGFNETGNTLAALNVDSDKTNTVFTTLGLRAATTLDLGNISPKARADIGWRHAYGDVDSESSARFTGSDIFTVGGTPVAKDVATLEAGLDFNLLPSTVLGVAYTGQFAKDVKQNGFNVKLAVSF